MLNFIKSLSKGHKRLIMLGLDGVLVVFALVFAFFVLELPGGVQGNFRSLMLLTPYLVIVAIGASMWIGIGDIQPTSYEAGSVALTAGHAGLLMLASLTLSDIAALGLPNGVHVVFGAVFFCLAVGVRAVLLQIGAGDLPVLQKSHAAS